MRAWPPTARAERAFTLVEVLISIGILALVLTAIYATWTAILRSAKSGQTAAAAVQRARIVARVLEDSLTSAQSFVANPALYGFLAKNGDEAMISFVARVSKAFPRSGRFGDFDVRRMTFSLQQGRDGPELVLRQVPLLLEMDEDEQEHPIVLAKNVKEFSLEFWDNRLNDWVDEWKQTNQIPRLVSFTLRLAGTSRFGSSVQEINRVVSIPSVAVLPLWQVPRGGPGQFPPNIGNPGGTNVAPPGTQPGVVLPPAGGGR